jgi:hypothetical protein
MNPATEYIKIILPDKFVSRNEFACIQIFSSSGQMVYTNKTNEKEFTIGCNQLSKGYAVIVLTNSKQKIAKKILIY